ncbi:MAG: formylglycine-generating enzyme family protein [Planctomycetota bacterium]|jgi:formylglycine-generating enzyme required for sulfatase activity
MGRWIAVLLWCLSMVVGCIEGKTRPPDGGGLEAGTDGPRWDGPPGDLPSDDGTVVADDHGAPADQGSAPSGWVSVPAGTFDMGSPTTEYCRDGTREQLHPVTLARAFWISETEVTQDQFQAEMGYNPSQFQGCGACPVENLSWHEAAAYCNALSTKEGLGQCYDCTGSEPSFSCTPAVTYIGGAMTIHDCPGYRLPTEAEWERAYRAGTQSAYYLGDNDSTSCFQCTGTVTLPNLMGWYCGNAASKTNPVGQKAKNAYGLYDMAGNVWEWTDDLFQTSLGSQAVTDPWNWQTGSNYTIRGGAWDKGPYKMRAAHREGREPYYRIGVIGFRCIRSQ